MGAASSQQRVEELIRELGLAPHPEGGFFRQIFKSGSMVGAGDRPPRSALTAIYFLLPAGEWSRWHRVQSDEVWTHVEGSPVILRTFDGTSARQQLLGPLSESSAPFVVIPAGTWQAAEPQGTYSLSACFVAPGFEFDDFAMMLDDPAATTVLNASAPELAHLI
jgi:predicted cupin superfamily sugar epimerase